MRRTVAAFLHNDNVGAADYVIVDGCAFAVCNTFAHTLVETLGTSWDFGQKYNAGVISVGTRSVVGSLSRSPPKSKERWTNAGECVPPADLKIVARL